MKVGPGRAFRRLLHTKPPDVQAARSDGHMGHVLVELADGTLYPVCFFDRARLARDLQAGATHVAKPGMIVVTEVTPENMETAVRVLCEAGFFEYLQPVDQEALEEAPDEWPPHPRRRPEYQRFIGEVSHWIRKQAATARSARVGEPSSEARGFSLAQESALLQVLIWMKARAAGCGIDSERVALSFDVDTNLDPDLASCRTRREAGS